MGNLELENKCRQYMKDCGCDEKQCRDFIQLQEKGDKDGQIRLLKRRRICVMDNLHVAQREVDCIDFIIRELEQEKRAGE